LLFASLALLAAGLGPGAIGCAEREPSYGVEKRVALEAKRREVWAVAPALNLSGYDVDALLQSDLLYQQLQQVRGLTVIPVNRVVEVYASLRIDKVQSPEQAAIVCDLLGCDALVIPTVTAFDPYAPPKLGASLQVMFKPGGWSRPGDVDPRELARQATPGASESVGGQAIDAASVIQAVGMFDAANGSVREALGAYAAGRNDPLGPMGTKEYLASMDRYCGFVYHELIVQVLNKAAARRAS
jgi:hypothetical protein